jgi:hypothetical protein
MTMGDSPKSYDVAKVVALLGLVAMTAVLIYGFTVGDFGEEGSILLSMPWGIVSMVDLYVGFTLFSGWIIYREKSPVRSIVWVILMMVLGSFTASLYALIALITSRGDWERFWLGNRMDSRRAAS